MAQHKTAHRDTTVIRPMTIEIERWLWDEFKLSVPRTKTLNARIIELIKQSLEVKA